MSASKPTTDQIARALVTAYAPDLLPGTANNGKRSPVQDADDDDRPEWCSLDQVDDAPPGPLLLNMLEPSGPNLLYAAPGVGKGTTGAWMICELQKMGLTVAIYDAERREREWRRRVSGLGADSTKVTYMSPAKLRKSLLGLPLWQIIEAGALDTMIARTGTDFLIVDSVLPAIGIGEERLKSDPQAPYLYVQALDSLRIPSLSFGHPPKGQPSGEPFGSMAWEAAMRMTWNGTRGEGGDRHVIRWTPRKRNERGHIAGVLLTVSYNDAGLPVHVERADDDESTRESILVLLRNGGRTVIDMTDELLDDVEGVTQERVERTKERLSRQLRRMAKDGEVLRPNTTGRTALWTLNFDKPKRR